MLSRIFPQQIDNTYRGYWLAIWLLVPLVLAKMAMGANSYFNTRYVIQGPDNIPLQSYNTDAQEMLVFMYQAWGLGLFLIAALGLLALIRYRAMVSLMYLVLTIENVGRSAFQLADALLTATSSGKLSFSATINLAFIAALIIGFALSLATKADAIGHRERRT
jgi:hypothetical protein